MVTKATGQPLGRRPRSLRDDPERYAIAYIAARLSAPLHLSAGPPTALAKIIMQAHHGIIDTPEKGAEVAEAIMAGREVRLKMKKHRGGNNVGSEQWRDRDSANALAANFWKKVSKLEKRLRDPSDAEDATSDQKDAHWLGLMTAAWRLAVGAYSYRGDPFAAAAAAAAKVGESDHFSNVIAPQFAACSFLRAPEEERSSLLARL